MGIGDLIADPAAFARAEHVTGESAHALRLAERELALDLLNDFETLADALRDFAGAGAWSNAFLAAAGMHQIVADHWSDPLTLALVGKRLRRTRYGAPAATVIARVSSAAGALRRLGDPDRSRERALAELARSLAAVALGGHRADATRALELALAQSRSAAEAPESLRRAILRIPSCFRSFDVQPDDLAALAERIAARWPDRARPLVLVGVRTSGSYLAPMMAAALDRLGCDDVRLETLRPGEAIGSRLATSLREAVRARGAVLVLDDPPNTGASFLRVAERIHASGVPRRRIAIVAPLLAAALPDVPALHRYAAVTLAPAEWAVQRRLAPEPVRRTLATLFGEAVEVLAVERQPFPETARARGHARGLYRVSLRENGEISERLVYAKGAGYGYFAEHALAVARRLHGRVPRPYGLTDGVLYREWLPGADRAEGRLPAAELARGVARYVRDRQEALAVSRDTAVELFGRGTDWRRGAEILARAHGAAAPLALPIAATVSKRILRVDRPSVADGAMDASRWFVRDGSLVKVTFADRDFASPESYRYDHVSDLAAAALAFDDQGAALRHEYARAGGEPIDEERWLLYTLVHLDAALRSRPEELVATRRRMSQAVQRYLAATVFADTRAPDHGPLCAIDVDGVLETGELGFTAMPPSAALALRALARHGYRALVATGRGAPEVRDRCEAYPLAGGVAEYGGAIVRRGGTIEVLLTARQRAELDEAPARALRHAGVRVDDERRASVRAYRLSGGATRGLSEADIASIAGPASGLVVIPGGEQTDIRHAELDKGTALQAFAGALAVDGPTPLAFAVGDSAADRPMLALAARRYAPASARDVDAAGVRRMREPYAGGFVGAVREEIGHAPGGCERCAPPPLSPRARLLLGALAPQGRGRTEKLAAMIGLALAATRG